MALASAYVTTLALFSFAVGGLIAWVRSLMAGRDPSYRAHVALAFAFVVAIEGVVLVAVELLHDAGVGASEVVAAAHAVANLIGIASMGALTWRLTGSRDRGAGERDIR